METQV